VIYSLCILEWELWGGNVVQNNPRVFFKKKNFVTEWQDACFNDGVPPKPFS
jgi:hypothetical protein